MRRRLANVRENPIAVINQRRRIARRLKIIDQQLTQLGLIFHDKNAWRVFINR